MNRDPAGASEERKRKERLGFVILQHLQTLTADAAGALLPELIATDLAMPVDETREILAMLTEQGFVAWDGGAGAALATKEGEDYVLRLAGRRRSVRFQKINSGRSSYSGEDRTAGRSAQFAPYRGSHGREQR
jgi:hypothetical protein